MILGSFAEGHWHTPVDGRDVLDAVTGNLIAKISSDGLNFEAMLNYARDVGGPALRMMTFHERALMIKALATKLNEYKEEFYELSYASGCTKADTWIDVDGGFGTLFTYSSKARIELPDEPFYAEGNTERLSRNGTFLGQHVMVPLRGVAVHINAFNFPVWGMLEKLAPTLIAGVPAIVKPASGTAYLTERVVRRMTESGILPDGAVQLVCGSVGDMFEHLTCQDSVAFTGSATTGMMLSKHPTVTQNAVRFISEQDSLNSSILGPDATPESPEFDLFVKEVLNEMTTKAGQKCTAIRRAIVPAPLVDSVGEALTARLANVKIGNPRLKEVRMGALANMGQRAEVYDRINEMAEENEILCGGTGSFELVDADYDKGAFAAPTVMYCDKPFEKLKAHSVEAFGPVSTIMPYETTDDAITLANMGEGSLVASLFTHDKEVVRDVVMGAGAYHGRLAVIDRDCAAESTGHGSPMPHLKHGGPGRAGGGEEMGGIRGVMHYMQRVAVQGSPDTITSVTNRWTTGSSEAVDSVHPFRKNFDEVEIGTTLHTKARPVTLEDVEHFANYTGDTFYAHMDEEAAAANPFFGRRVAHGYLLLSFAAGLFVDPAPGPVLANYGLNDLQFMQPVYPGDVIKVRLVCKSKKGRPGQIYGEVRWDVTITNQDDDVCANYELLTLNERAEH